MKKYFYEENLLYIMLTSSRNLRINLYTIQDDHFPKRKH